MNMAICPNFCIQNIQIEITESYLNRIIVIEINNTEIEKLYSHMCIITCFLTFLATNFNLFSELLFPTLILKQLF